MADPVAMGSPSLHGRATVCLLVAPAVIPAASIGWFLTGSAASLPDTTLDVRWRMRLCSRAQIQWRKSCLFTRGFSSFLLMASGMGRTSSVR